MNYIALNYQVLVQKIGPVSIVGHYASYFGCCKKNISRFFFFKKIRYLFLVTKIELRRSAKQQIVISFLQQLSNYCTAYHSPVSGYIYIILFTDLHFSSIRLLNFQSLLLSGRTKSFLPPNHRRNI